MYPLLPEIPTSECGLGRQHLTAATIVPHALLPPQRTGTARPPAQTGNHDPHNGDAHLGEASHPGPELTNDQINWLFQNPVGQRDGMLILKRIMGGYARVSHPRQAVYPFYMMIMHFNRLGVKDNFQPVDSYFTRWVEYNDRLNTIIDDAWLQEETEAARYLQDLLVVILNRIHRAHGRYLTEVHISHRLSLPLLGGRMNPYGIEAPASLQPIPGGFNRDGSEGLGTLNLPMEENTNQPSSGESSRTSSDRSDIPDLDAPSKGLPSSRS